MFFGLVAYLEARPTTFYSARRYPDVTSTLLG